MLRARMETQALAKANYQGDQSLVHFSHPQHPLVRMSLPYLFMCMGCREYGAGKRFRCQRCDFDLHDFCALAPPSLINHPFHHQHQLVFFTRPAGGFLRSRCHVCGKNAKGYAFRCTSCSLEMHPCCASMHKEMCFPSHQHPLRLSRPAAASSADSGVTCNLCQKKKSGGQMYHCVQCKYNLHAVCAKDMVNGLYAYGMRAPPEKANNVLGSAARMATHAFFGIIGGLIEGIGEGFGEALIENIGRGSVKSIKDDK